MSQARPVEHGTATPSQGAVPPQGPWSRAGTFLLRSGDLSKLTTGQAPSDARPVVLALRSGSEILRFEPRVS